MINRMYDPLDVLMILYFSVLGVLLVRSHYIRQIAPLFSIHRARPYRNLSKDEVQELSNISENPDITEPISVWMWVMLLVKIVVALGLAGTIIFAYVPSMPTVWIAIFVVIGTILFLIVFSDTMGKKLKKDLKSPVYLLQDTIRVVRKDKRSHFDYRVGRYEFKYKLMMIDAYSSSQMLKDGDSVTIEFSPNSHYVWRIEKMS